MKKRNCLYAILCTLALLLSACTAEQPPETSAPIETKPPVETTAPVETTQPKETTAPTETTAPVETTPPIPEGAYPAGEYEVGKDIPTGEYVFIPYAKDQDAVIQLARKEQPFFYAEFWGQFFWDPQAGDMLTVTDCYFFPSEGYTVPANPDGTYGPGMYRIGIDIPEGEYQFIHKETVKQGKWCLFSTINDYPVYSLIDTPGYLFSEPDYRDITGMVALLLGEESYAVPASPPENATFLFPEAPEVLEVKALPDSYDAAALVSPYWEQGVAFGETRSFYISIPEIYPFSQEVITVQKEIYQLFHDRLNGFVRYSVENPVTETLDMSEVTIFSDFGGAPIAYHGYSAGIRDGILSVTVRNDWEGSVGRTYSIYNFDLSTGKRLYSQDMTDRLGVSQDAVAQGITEYYEEMHTALPDKTVDFYQENLNKTLSEENLAAGQLCIGEDGAVMMVVEIYTIGSLEHVQRLVKIAD